MAQVLNSPVKIGIVISFTCLLFTGCAAVHSVKLANECRSGLEIANAELSKAKLNGFSSTVSWVKAASLLTGAKIQQQFDKFPNCINKVARARHYIRRSQEEK